MLCHPERAAEQRLCGGAAEGHHQPGPDQPELFSQPGIARPHLGGTGLLVKPALDQLLPHELEVLDGVGDVDLGAVDPRRLQPLVQQSPRGSYERPADAVLLVARLLPDEHHPGLRGALPEHGLCGVDPEVAAAALLRGLAELRQSGARRDEVGGRASGEARHGGNVRPAPSGRRDPGHEVSPCSEAKGAMFDMAPFTSFRVTWPP